MGTNYYAVKNRITTGLPIHIGKSSAGWRFIFQEQNGISDGVIWHTYDQVYEWLYKKTVEKEEYVIMDEYDEVISFNDFIKMVESKQSETHPLINSDYGCERNINGYRFTDREFF